MEAEIVSMCLRIFHNPQGAGTMTSGGTESIIMAVKTHRDWAKATKCITEPEMCADSPPPLNAQILTDAIPFIELYPPRHMLLLTKVQTI
jgi:hypothetical protein